MREIRTKPTDGSLHCRFLFPKKVQLLGVDENTGAISLPQSVQSNFLKKESTTKWKYCAMIVGFPIA
jgi:hypothetical protein